MAMAGLMNIMFMTVIIMFTTVKVICGSQYLFGAQHLLVLALH